MKLRITLATATALGLIMTAAAYAGGSSLYITQSGDGQSAAIDQSGSTSGASVGVSTSDRFIQDNGTTGGVSGAGGNILVINQNSASNSELDGGAAVHGYPIPNITGLEATGSGNKVTGFQSGTNNNAEIDQMGSDGTVELKQTGANNGRTGEPFVTPHFWTDSPFGNIIVQDSSASGSTVKLTQSNDVSGVGNIFSIGQGGTDNEIDATQTGFNRLNIRQASQAPDLWVWSFGNAFDPSSAIGPANSLSPIGGNNKITVTQDTSGIADPYANNYANVGQGGGSLNQLTVHQSGAANVADANQVGSSNEFSSTQTNIAGAGTNFVGGEAGWPDTNVNPLHPGNNGDYRPILQLGTSNSYDSTQSGTNLWAFGSQIGINLSLTNEQYGDTNKLFSTQIGSDNEISNYQSGNDGTATYDQSGSYNVATLQDQKGSYNTVDVTQSGAGGLGSENTVTMLQNGDNNSIVMAQSGLAGNEAYLVQGGTFSGAPLTTATLTLGTAGNSNNIDGSQDGTGNWVAVSQSGSTNNANFSQTGTGNTATIVQ